MLRIHKGYVREIFRDMIGMCNYKAEQYWLFSSNTIPIQYQGSSIAIQYHTNTNAILTNFPAWKQARWGDGKAATVKYVIKCEVYDSIFSSHLICYILLFYVLQLNLDSKHFSIKVPLSHYLICFMSIARKILCWYCQF